MATLVSCASCLPVLVCPGPNEGLPGSADFVSEDFQGGYFVEFDDASDE